MPDLRYGSFAPRRLDSLDAMPGSSETRSALTGGEPRTVAEQDPHKYIY
jgi:hypothetical protein